MMRDNPPFTALDQRQQYASRMVPFVLVHARGQVIVMVTDLYGKSHLILDP